MRLLQILGATFLGLFFAVSIGQAATVLFPSGGGTGSTTLTGILKGNGAAFVRTAVSGTDYQAPITLTTTGSSGAATFTANTLNIPQYSGGSGSSAFEIATTSSLSVPQLAYFTKTSGRTTLGGVSTTSLTATSPLALSQPISVLGSSASALTIDTTGAWSGNAGTATALAANGTNCSAGNYPLGVDASGNVETCTLDVKFSTTSADFWVTSTTTLPSITTLTGLTTLKSTFSGLMGVNSGVLYTFASSSLFGYTPLNPTRALTVAGTANQITSSAGSQDLSADRTWTLSIPSQFNIQNASTTNHSSNTLAVGGTATTSIAANGNLTAGGTLVVTGQTTLATSLSGLLKATSGVVSTGSNGTDYTLISANSCSNQFLRTVTAAGVFTCATVGAADVSLANLTATDATLTFSGTYTGATARTIGLNLGNANTWTALQQFSLASSTQFSAASQTFYVDSTGHIQGKDTVSGNTGVLSPTRAFVLGSATTTQWIASTTASAYSPYLVMPFAGTLRTALCKTESTGSFLGVNVQVNGSNAAPSYFVASSTVGTETFTSGNTFTAGQKILANFGTTTNDGTQTNASVSCTFTATETP